MTAVKPKKRKVILTFADYYLPGFKAGGPIRAISNMVETLAADFQFHIVTRDRDLGDNEPYAGITPDEWSPVGAAEVLYLPREKISFMNMLELLQTHPYHAIYLNSFFSTLSIRVLVLRRLGLIPPVPVILAPRGEFSPGALQFKSSRKKSYIALAKSTELCRGVIWQASSDHEAADIRNVWRDDTRFAANVQITSELLSPKAHSLDARTPKQKGILHAAIVLRISSKKNLDGALRLLRGVKGPMTWSVYGPVEDPEYWNLCKRLIAGLPDNVRVTYHGPIDHDEVGKVLAKKDLFFFPTFGENFGHAIIEALEAGCPVLISDQTPWRDLEERGVGWDIPLEKPELFHAAIEKVIAMDEHAHRRLCENAVAYVGNIARDPEIVESNRHFFDAALKSLPLPVPLPAL